MASGGGAMRLERIAVTGLFGMFDHVIPLNMEERITIIHGPNGFGKTVLLRLIAALLSSRYPDVRTIPFRSVRLDFSGKRTLEVRRGDGADLPKARRSQSLVFEYVQNGQRQKYDFSREPVELRHFPLHFLEQQIPGLERTGREIWTVAATQEELTLDQVLDRYSEYLPFIQQHSRTPEPTWMRDFRKAIPVRFIETQRLLRYPKTRRPREHEGRASMVPAVTAYAEELAATIRETLANYANLSQSLDRTFPTRLVSGQDALNLSLDEVRNELSSLEEKRSRLVTLGLLDQEQEIDFRQLQAIDEKNRNVLAVYVKDAAAKLSVFDDLSARLELFKRSINERFLYKEMSINSKSGFVFHTFDEQPLPANGLSSGEQHEVILFYELLFKVAPNSLILIDEPELSLHVLWQQQFLKDLGGMTRLGAFDVLIATHSPQIIHDRLDLAVELKGPIQQRVVRQT
jgi:predicted ATP-binding protein involved in virulence